MSRIEKAKEVLEAKWSDQGACGSCGWHSSLFECYIDDSDIEWAVDENNGVIELGCCRKDGEGDNHRGTKIFIGGDDE